MVAPQAGTNVLFSKPLKDLRGEPPSGSVSRAEKVAVPPCWTSCCMGLEVMADSSRRTVNVAEADEAEYVESPKNMALTVYGPAASPGVTGHEAVPVRPVVPMHDSLALRVNVIGSRLMPAPMSSVSMAVTITWSLKAAFNPPR